MIERMEKRTVNGKENEGKEKMMYILKKKRDKLYRICYRSRQEKRNDAKLKRNEEGRIEESVDDRRGMKEQKKTMYIYKKKKTNEDISPHTLKKQHRLIKKRNKKRREEIDVYIKKKNRKIEEQKKIYIKKKTYHRRH